MLNHVASVVLPDVRDVQFLSDSYDTLVQSKTIMGGRFASFPRRLDLLASNVGKISKAVDEMPHYNLSIQLLDCWGTPSQRGGTCARYRKILLKAIFRGLGVDVLATNIDIAHRVPLRNATFNNGDKRHPNPFIRKFTGRMDRDEVLASRGCPTHY